MLWRHVLDKEASESSAYILITSQSSIIAAFVLWRAKYRRGFGGPFRGYSEGSGDFKAAKVVA